jgi:hypothetical protein
MPGQQSQRPLWGDALRLATAVAFVIDSTDEARLPLVAHELRRLMPRLCKQQAPILFLAAKQDAPGARSVPDVLAATGLAAACAALPAPWALRGCSAGDYHDLCGSFRWAARRGGRACWRPCGRGGLPAGGALLLSGAAWLPQVAAGPCEGAGGAARGEGGQCGRGVPAGKPGVRRQGEGCCWGSRPTCCCCCCWGSGGPSAPRSAHRELSCASIIAVACLRQANRAPTAAAAGGQRGGATAGRAQQPGVPQHLAAGQRDGQQRVMGAGGPAAPASTWRVCARAARAAPRAPEEAQRLGTRRCGLQFGSAAVSRRASTSKLTPSDAWIAALQLLIVYSSSGAAMHTDLRARPGALLRAVGQPCNRGLGWASPGAGLSDLASCM